MVRDPLSRVLSANEAHDEAMGLPVTEVVSQLVDLLGAPTVAEIGGVKESRAVVDWISGKRAPQRPHVLRFALQLAIMISSYASRNLAQAWFHGANPRLDDRVPVVLLRDEPLEEIQASMMVAVRAFAARPTIINGNRS